MGCGQNWQRKYQKPQLEVAISVLRFASLDEENPLTQRIGQNELEDQVLYPRFSINEYTILLTTLDYIGWRIGGRPGNRNGKPEHKHIRIRERHRMLNSLEETISQCDLTRMSPRDHGPVYRRPSSTRHLDQRA